MTNNSAHKTATACPYCRSEQTTPIVSYRHYWTECLACGTIIRTGTKERYFVERFIPQALMRILYEKTKPGYERGPHGGMSYRVHRLVRYFANFYCKPRFDFQDGALYTAKRYFALSQADIDAKKDVYGDISQALRATGTSLDGGDVLDISGGTGWLQYYIAHDPDVVRKPHVVSTEFQQSACEAVEKSTGYKFVKFDYAKDKLADVLPGMKFDTIFVVMSLGFCRDMKAFFADAKNVLRDESSRIVVQYPTPSIADCTVWMNQEYTFLTLYAPAIVNSTLEELGYTLLREEPTRSSHFVEATALFLDRLMVKFYLVLNRVRNRSSNRNVYCSGVLAVYENSARSGA